MIVILLLQKSSPWILYLQDKVDFNDGDPYSHTFKLQSNAVSNYSIRMNTTSIRTVPFAMSIFLNPLDVNTGVIYALILLTGLYVLIMFEVSSIGFFFISHTAFISLPLSQRVTLLGMSSQ